LALFIDQVKIILKAGKGGNGCVSFRREYRVPRGGPDGGRGGDGGSVYFVSDTNIGSLVYFRFHPLIRAGKGAPGEGSDKQGKRGADVRLSVPPGTVVKEAETGQVLFDFNRSGLVYLAARGGKGGRGNASFATSVRQAPRDWEPGRPGEEKNLVLELKLIADVGLIGFPNSGKSTLISRISAARPLIADYPFTTLIPNLGVVAVDETRSFIVADIPGIIKGAHVGQGLGLNFLRHIERTKILVHLIDVSPFSGREPAEDFEVLMEELKTFNPQLARRPQIIAANKIDLLASETERKRLEGLRRLARKKKIPFLAVSALKKQGLSRLIKAMLRELDKADGGRSEQLA